MAYFNPRSGERSDRILYLLKRYEVLISIHAPANGATARQIYPTPVISNFNPRSGERSDGDSN